MYVDHAATTTLRPSAFDAMRSVMDDANGNASGTHAVARAAKNALEVAREEAAELLGASRSDEIVFTSGGTESDNLAIVGAALSQDASGIVVSAIEHKAVLEAAASLERFGYHTSLAGCGSDGVVAPGAVAHLVTDATAVVSVMAANNEIGTVQPIAAIAAEVGGEQPGTVVHTDAVQAFVGADISVEEMGVDLLTLAAHKFGGPKGVGVLYVRSGTDLDPIVHGGGQEAGRRSGTSNVAGVVGMVAAMKEAIADRDRFRSEVGSERDAFEDVMTHRVGAIVTSAGSDRLPHFSHLRVPGVDAETLLIRLDAAGVYAAAGSACQSGAIEPSHVLMAMGMEDRAASECVRFSFGWDTAAGEGEAVAHIVADVVEAMR